MLCLCLPDNLTIIIIRKFIVQLRKPVTLGHNRIYLPILTPVVADFTTGVRGIPVDTAYEIKPFS